MVLEPPLELRAGTEEPHWLSEKSEKSPSEGERKTCARPILELLTMGFSRSVPVKLSLKWKLTASLEKNALYLIDLSNLNNTASDGACEGHHLSKKQQCINFWDG